MSPRWPLARKIAGLAVLNLVLVVVIMAIFVGVHFGGRPENWVLGPARDRLIGLAQSVALDLSTAASVQPVLDRYGQTHGADFYVAGPRGESLAEQSIELPEPVRRRLRPREGPPPPPRGPPGRRNPPQDPIFLVSSENGYWVGVRLPIKLAGDTEQRPGLLLMRSSSIFNSQLFFDYRAWLTLPVALLGASVLCWLPFVRGLTNAIGMLSRVTDQIAAGDFDAAVPTHRRDELGQLGKRIHELAGRLAGFVRGQKRFLGDIAHELSAPIARVQFAVGILEQNSSQQQQRHIAILREDLGDMSSLVAELLSFSKAGLNPGDTPISAVSVMAIVERIASRESDARLEIEVEPELLVMANESFLQRSISNLVRNAIRYAGHAGPIAIRASLEGNTVAIAVSDCGPGLPEAELEKIFAPFYRPEEARTRETGGIGLGLAIVKSCVEACRGTIECHNCEPHGLEVIVRLPAAQK